MWRNRGKLVGNFAGAKIKTIPVDNSCRSSCIDYPAEANKLMSCCWWQLATIWWNQCMTSRHITIKLTPHVEYFYTWNCGAVSMDVLLCNNRMNQWYWPRDWCFILYASRFLARCSHVCRRNPASLTIVNPSKFCYCSLSTTKLTLLILRNRWLKIWSTLTPTRTVSLVLSIAYRFGSHTVWWQRVHNRLFLG